MRQRDARNVVITLLKNVAPFGGTGARKPYSETALRNAYPRSDAEATTLALSDTGGPLPGPGGTGTPTPASRRHNQRAATTPRAASAMRSLHRQSTRVGWQ